MQDLILLLTNSDWEEESSTFILLFSSLWTVVYVLSCACPLWTWHMVECDCGDQRLAFSVIRCHHLGFGDGLISLWSKGSLIRPGGCSVSPKDLPVSAFHVLGLQVCITVVDCFIGVMGINLRSSYLKGQPYSNWNVSLSPFGLCL